MACEDEKEKYEQAALQCDIHNQEVENAEDECSLAEAGVAAAAAAFWACTFAGLPPAIILCKAVTGVALAVAAAVAEEQCSQIGLAEEQAGLSCEIAENALDDWCRCVDLNGG